MRLIKSTHFDPVLQSYEGSNRRSIRLLCNGVSFIPVFWSVSERFERFFSVRTGSFLSFLLVSSGYVGSNSLICRIVMLYCITRSYCYTMIDYALIYSVRMGPLSVTYGDRTGSLHHYRTMP